MATKRLPTGNQMGTRIRKWRKLRGMKAYELAEKIRISQGSLSDIENNISLPSALTLVNFIKYTTVDVLWVLTGVRNLESKRNEKVQEETNSLPCPVCDKARDSLLSLGLVDDEPGGA